MGPDETDDSTHARESGGPGWALSLHGAYEFGGPDAVRALPGGPEWLEVIERAPVDQRHLEVHRQHCVGLNEADAAAWDAGGGSTLQEVTLSGTCDTVRRKLDEYREQGVTEIVFQPCGPDVERELSRFLDAVALTN